MEKQYKAIVNHNGSCHGIHFQMNVPVILTQSAINALGYANVKILQEIESPKPEIKKEVVEVKKEEPKIEPKKEEPKTEAAKKQIRFPVKDKMVKTPGKSK